MFGEEVSILYESLKEGHEMSSEDVVEIVIGALSHHNDLERRQMAAEYEDQYGMTLSQAFEDVFDGDFKKFCLALIQEPADAPTDVSELCKKLQAAMGSNGINEDAFIEVLSLRTKDLAGLVHRYWAMYGMELDIAVRINARFLRFYKEVEEEIVEGHFEKLCVAIINFIR